MRGLRLDLMYNSRKIFVYSTKSIAAVVFIFSFLPYRIYAQQQKARFRSITVQNGLSQNFVQCVFKDKKGYMWFGTRYGLNQYDGYKITTYHFNPDDPKSISSNSVNDIIEDKEGNLFIATNRGLNKWDRSKKCFIHYSPPKTILKISDLSLDSKGRIWVATVNAGLLLFDANKGTFDAYLQQNPKSNDVNKVLEYKPDILWVTSKAGLDQLDVKTRKISHFPVDPDDPKKLAKDFDIKNRTASFTQSPKYKLKKA